MEWFGRRKGLEGDLGGYLCADSLSRPNNHRGSQKATLQSGHLMDDGTGVYLATNLMYSFHLLK